MIFIYLASMVWETIKELDEFNPVQHDLRKALDTPAIVLTGHIREVIPSMRVSMRQIIC